MTEIKSIEVRCMHKDCREWFPNRLFMYDHLEAFLSSDFYGNRHQCPHCGRLTACDAQNVRVRGPDGGFLGHDT